MRSSALISILAVLTTTALASPALHSTHYTKEGSPTTKLAARHVGSDKVIPTYYLKRQIHNADYGSSPSTIPAAGDTGSITAPNSENTSRPGIRANERDMVEDVKDAMAQGNEKEREPATAPSLRTPVKELIGNNTTAPSGVKGMSSK